MDKVLEKADPEKIVDKVLEKAAPEEKAEKQMQSAVLNMQHKYGKNAILKGINLQEGATAKDRNQQVGGDKA